MKRSKSKVFPLFDGKPVTRTYSRLLWDCRRHGWRGTLNSGKRSWAKQLWLWTMYWVKHAPGFAPADRPEKSAHVKLGWRCAVDVSRGDEFVHVARARQWPVVRPYLPREPWHMQFSRKPRNTQLKHGPH